MKGLAGLLIACFIFFSIGCGGGSDDKDKADPNQNENIESSLTQEEGNQPPAPAPTEFTQISEAEFEKLTQVGTWRISSNVRMVGGTTSVTDPPSNMVANFRTIEAVTSSESAYQFCDGYGVKPNDPAENLSAEAEMCGDGTNMAYYKKDNGHFKASITCKSGDSAEMEVNKISNEFGFNLGSLKFLPEKYPAIDTNKNVCANVLFHDVRPDVDAAILSTWPYDPSRKSMAIQVLAPYAGGFITLTLSFPWKTKETLKAGTYHVDETGHYLDSKTSNTVIIAIAPSAFGLSLSIPVSLPAKSGTVHLEYFDEFEAKGTYEFTALDGEKVTGSFSYLLK